MAKTWSWGEVAKGNKRAKGTGSGGTGGGFFVRGDLDYEMGDLQRLTIPYVLDESGQPKMLIYSAPIHYIEKRGFIKLQGPKGGTYSPYSIRCMNPLSQVDFEKGKEIAERGQYCALCTLASLQTTARFAKIEEKYGSVEEFKAIPKDNAEKKAFIDSLNEGDRVRASYNNQRKETNYETYMLVLRFESETKEVAGDFGIEKVSTVKLGTNGLPIWKPLLMKVSQKRIEKFTKALQDAGRNRQLAPEMIHSFTDATGQEVKTAFIDFELDFPVRNEKMNSAADLEIRAMSTEKSCITQAFVDEILGKSKDLIEKADLAWEKSHANLQEFTNDEYQSYMEDKGAYFTSLKEQYLIQNDVEFARKVLETAKGNNQFAKKEDGNTSGTEATETVTVPDEKPVKENTAVADESAIPAEDLLGLGDLEI
ncbi:TPA: hypothetical protein ACHIJV_001695 [Enterococcus faecium]